MNNEIEIREKQLQILYEFNKVNHEEAINEKLLSEITQTLKNLRIVSVNIVGHFMKIKECCSILNSNSKKYNLSKINKENYKYRRNYLVKMISDTNFLRHSILEKYFNFSSFSDPFFLSLTSYSSEQPNEGENKISLPLSEDLYLSIKNW